jgi:hypothetical protein
MVIKKCVNLNYPSKFYEISQYHSKNKNKIIINKKKQLENIYFFSKTNIIKLKRVGFSKKYFNPTNNNSHLAISYFYLSILQLKRERFE